MSTLNIVCIDDQRDVLATLKKDLQVFTTHCQIIDCESAEEAQEVLEDINDEGNYVAVVICDHLMPKKNGVDYLIEINEDNRFQRTKKLLLTGMATHKDTIEAINMAQIDRYIEKPWEQQQLVETVKVLLTLFIMQEGISYKTYLDILDQSTLYKELRSSMGE